MLTRISRLTATIEEIGPTGSHPNWDQFAGFGEKFLTQRKNLNRWSNSHHTQSVFATSRSLLLFEGAAVDPLKYRQRKEGESEAEWSRE